MSGFEIAGVVLGALPVLFACVDLPKQGIQRGLLLFRKRAYVDKLARALLLQKQIIAENIKSVASAAGCDDVWLIDDDPYTYLNDRKVQAQILDYLGSENYTAFSAVLGQSHDILKKLALNLRGFLPGGEGPSDDLLEIIARNSLKTRKLDLAPRVKLVFAIKDIKSAVEELDKTAADIDRFTKVVLSNRQTVSGSASRKATRLAKTLRRVRDSAEDLAFALQDCWKSGCHEQHEASLFLDDRVKSTPAMPDGGTRKKKVPPEVVFRLLLSSQTNTGQALSYHAAVQVDNDEPDMDTDITGSSASEGPHIRFQTTATTEMSFQSKPLAAIPGLVSVESICLALKLCLLDKGGAWFVLTKDGRIGLKQSTNKTSPRPPDLTQSARRICLKDILSSGSGSPHKNPLKFRMLLALRLASNLLQLHNTRWLGKAWSKHSVSFPLRSSQVQGAEVADLDQPFVSLSFSGVMHSNSKEEPPVELKVALLELGILLLEIWHQESFESRCGGGDGHVPSGYYQRLALAIEWLDDAADPMPEQYEKAASLCIRCVIGGTSNFAGWDDMAFWSAVCADIIEPLQKNCKPWQRA
ncbi:hypothetical protein GE09DRAFT_1166780 [Coniochaeta sp. 2T2.1]|nr:hypothetical protein GE09DRAFT_1166780 [Coniochaeta sp. 2T2.1]